MGYVAIFDHFSKQARLGPLIQVCSKTFFFYGFSSADLQETPYR
jgi:hypothetical protein